MSSNSLLSDYVLPVPMTDLQMKVTSAVVSSNFSEILSFFDGSEQSRVKYLDKLRRMMSDLNLVATHPYLLLEHMQPNLSSKRAPQQIESVSGKFQSLVTLTKRFTDPSQNVAIICEAGSTTDLVELVLADRALNVTRYSSPPTSKLYKKDIMKRRGATFHLVPSSFEDLMQAVYAAFDLVIVLDNNFDVNSDYGRGLRAQLRDPSDRAPYATVLRLVSLNSAQHVELLPSLTFPEQIATTVVLKKQVGAIPSLVKQYYVRDLSPLQPFINNPDGSYPLPPLEAVKIANHKDVEKSLYLDDEDQYQIEFSNRSLPGRRAHAKIQAAVGESEEEESGVDDLRITDVGSRAPDLDSKAAFPIKRRRMEMEEETFEALKELSVADPLSYNLLTKLNELLAERRVHEQELESHRKLASNRELELEKSREFMHTLALKIRELEKQNLISERKVEKLRARNEKVEADYRNKELWWDKLTTKLEISGTEAAKLSVLTERLAESDAHIERLEKSLANEKSRFCHLQVMSNASSQFADQLSKNHEILQQENNDLKAKVQDGPGAREAAISQQLKAKKIEVEALKVELSNLEESIRTQLMQDRAGAGHRGDRRYGRGGRGAGRHTSPHVLASSS